MAETRHPDAVLTSFGLNLFLLLALGVVASFWMIWFTEWFPALGGLLALSGAFSWLAFVSKALPEKVLKQLQCRVYVNLQKRAATRILGFLWFLALFGVIFRYGGVRLQSMTAATSHGAVYVHAPGSERGDPFRLPPGGELRIPLSAGFFGSNRWETKVEGFPAVFPEIHSLRRNPIFVPQSLNRRVILVRPKIDYLADWHRDVRELVIVHGKKKWRISGYNGYSFWIGCGADVMLPERWKERFRAQLERANRTQYLGKWLLPESVSTRGSWEGTGDKPSSEFEIEDGTIEVVVRHESNEVWRRMHTVSAGKPDDFVQLFDLESP
jgi:hypothetical protein